MPRVAVLLSGCGVYDGSEILEASSVLIHLSRLGMSYECFAPDKLQTEVIDHITGDKLNETRNVIVESARISRGKISRLKDFKIGDFCALTIPGGFGAAKNLSNFGNAFSKCEVDGDVARFIMEFHAASKPIGLCCIAPVLIAKLIPGAQITLGGESDEDGKWPFNSACNAIKEMGANHVSKDATQVHVDKLNKIVTTPAFMCGNSGPHDVFIGIGKMIETLKSLC